MSVRICNFPKADGLPCGSPALHGKRLCFFHHRDNQRRQHVADVLRRADVLGPRLPHMKSLDEIQAALSEVLNAMARPSHLHQRAGRILFDLQQAAIPFRQQTPAPD